MDYQALVSDQLGQGLYQELGLDTEVSLVWVLVQEVYPVVGLDLVVLLEVHLDLEVNQCF